MTNSDNNRPPLRWMKIIGAFYLLQFAMMAMVRASIRTFGPHGTLSKAAAGDALARFVVYTWTIFGFGLEVGAVGAMLLIAARRTELAAGAIWTRPSHRGRAGPDRRHVHDRSRHQRRRLRRVDTIHSVVIVTG